MIKGCSVQVARYAIIMKCICICARKKERKKWKEHYKQMRAFKK